MSVFRNRKALEAARGIRKFFSPETGSTRARQSEPVPKSRASALEESEIRPENLV